MSTHAHPADLRRLIEVATSIVVETDLTAVLGQLVRAAAQSLGLERNSILLLSAEGDTLSHGAAMGLPDEYTAALNNIPIGPTAGTCGVAAFAGQTVITSDLLTDPNWVPYRFLAEPHGLSAVWSVPLLGRDTRVLGTLAANDTEPGTPSDAQLELLTLYARLTTMAVERHEARHREERLTRAANAQAAQAEAMATISAALGGTLEPEQLYALILEQAVHLLPSDHALIMLYADNWATVGAAWGAPAPPVGTRLYPIAGPGKPWLPTDYPGAVYLAETAAEPAWVEIPPYVGAYRTRSCLAAPLTIDGVAVGSLNLHSSQAGYYGEHQLPLATAFAERVCQALRNARLYQAEQERRRAAEDLAQLRNDFLGAVSHELRTPLTSVIGYAELLRARGALLNDAQRLTYVDRIVTAANRQQRLVEDLLETSRVEAGMLRCERTPFVLRQVLERAVSEVQASYRGQHVALHGPDDLEIAADAGRTLQILINLIDNAAKYSPDRSPVVVSWAWGDAQAAVRVRDWGPGIPEAGRPQLFTRFGRLAGSKTRAGRTGTGLGLYLSRLLARAMDGELELEGTGPEGSIFRLCLPLAPAS